MTNNIDSDIRARIIRAADELFEAGGRDQLPTVSAVRGAARVDMNSASLVMKEWRKALTAQAVKPAVVVPDAVTSALVEVGAVAWQQAQTLANEALQAAQQSWEIERDDAEAQRIDLANSFDEQAKLLDELQNTAAAAAVQSASDAAEAVQLLAKAQAETKDFREQLAQAQAQATQADARAVEIEKRANDLRVELDRARVELDELKRDSKDLGKKLEQARTELGSVTNRLSESEAKRDAESSKHNEQYKRAIDDAAMARDERDAAKAMVSDAQQAASAAREEAAELRGQLKGFELQTNELVKQLKSVTAVAKKQ